MDQRPCPPLEYTIQDFKKWCKHCGHSRELEALQRFQQFCYSDYCLTVKEVPQTIQN